MEEDKTTATASTKQSFEDHNPQLYLAFRAGVQAKSTMDTSRGVD